jgi:hypothetical protein
MLGRNAMLFMDQDQFGSSDNPAGDRGNCFQVCLACILGEPLSEVPHFYNTDEPLEQQHANIRNWLRERGWLWFCFEWRWFAEEIKAERPPLPPAGLVVVSGKSPRGDWAHAVVGRVTAVGWELVHDPHPSKAGIDGDPEFIQIVAPVPFLGRRPFDFKTRRGGR